MPNLSWNHTATSGASMSYGRERTIKKLDKKRLSLSSFGSPQFEIFYGIFRNKRKSLGILYVKGMLSLLLISIIIAWDSRERETPLLDFISGGEACTTRYAKHIGIDDIPPNPDADLDLEATDAHLTGYWILVGGRTVLDRETVIKQLLVRDAVLSQQRLEKNPRLRKIGF